MRWILWKNDAFLVVKQNPPLIIVVLLETIPVLAKAEELEKVLLCPVFFAVFTR